MFFRNFFHHAKPFDKIKSQKKHIDLSIKRHCLKTLYIVHVDKIFSIFHASLNQNEFTSKMSTIACLKF